ncbi:MAG: esterase-like activity of phytase family protein, partial [Synechococcales bacterium]|nr:esterase-like activity of phytase family protein [Synechococcales bacterium]
IYIQSFEVKNLQDLNGTIMPTAKIDIPLVQLFGGSGRPYDFVVSGDQRTYDDLAKPAGLAEIAKYANGIGPNKQRIVPLSTVDANNDGRPDDLNRDGQISDGDRITGTPTTLISDAHNAGLFVHLYTLRNESFFLPSSYRGDPVNEYKQFIELGVDGFFTDFPGTGFTARSTFIQTPAVANLGGSRGFEGQAISPDKSKIYPLLEGAVAGDPTNALRIYEFDVATQQYQGLKGFYKLENPSHAIGDMTVINANEYLVIERDNGQGSDAKFKKIFKIDLSQKDANGFFRKEELVDLLNIADPQDFNRDGSTTYRMPFVTIENVLVLDERTILVANDNNYPFSIGRPPAIDNNEIVILELDKTLKLDPRVGQAGLTLPSPSVNPSGNNLFGTQANELLETSANTPTQLFGNGGKDVLIGGDAGVTAYGGSSDDTFFLGNGNNTVFGNGGNDRFTTGSGNDIIYGGSGDDFVNSGTGDDQIYLNGGRDRVVLNAGQGSATIYGFDSDDRIELGSNLSRNQINIDRRGQDTVLSVGSDILATIKWSQNQNPLIV